MPARARVGQGTIIRGSPESSEAQASDESLQPLEGAVGYQNPPQNVAINDFSLHTMMRRSQTPTTEDADNENNNVDENSNDHQFPRYANYHEQYIRQQNVVEERLPNLPNASAAEEEAGRNRVYQRLQDFDQTDRGANLYGEAATRCYSDRRRHRRNHSEDIGYSVSMNPPSRNHLASYENWLPRRVCPTQQEIEAEAQELLYNFTLEEFREQHVNPPEDLTISSGFSNPAWSVTGRDLRNLADAFSRSNERNSVRRKAQSVDMSSLNMEEFFFLCSELFQGNGGVTQERIVVLFTFVSDVAIHHVRQKAGQFIKRLMMWSLNFIVRRVCSWVQQAGGWNVVLQTSANIIYKWTMFTLAAVSIVALGVYIKKTLKDL